MSQFGTMRYTYSCIACIALALCSSVVYGQLSPTYYSSSCTNLLSTVKSVVKQAIANEKRMGASLLRLHFHDCFVNGCDGSILLDDSSTLTGEKTPLRPRWRQFAVELCLALTLWPSLLVIQLSK